MSFISLVSMLGITLGVAALITVLSVMNGFDEAIHRRFFSMAPEITITARDDNGFADWVALRGRVMRHPDVIASAPVVAGQGMMTFQGRIVPVIITGVDPQIEQGLTGLSAKLIDGKVMPLTPFGALLGQTLAQRLGVTVGDSVVLMIPQVTTTLVGAIPRFKRFNVIGVFKAGSGFGFDERLAFIDLHDAQQLFQLGDKVTGLRIKTTKIYAAPAIATAMKQSLSQRYRVGDWTEQYGAFFHAVKMEKTMMFLMLILIIAVAAFNQIASLVMLVKDKQADIAILRTIGATPALVMKVFLWQGAIVGLMGSGVGLVLGLLLAANITHLVNGLQATLGVELFAANVYFVDELPSKILWGDVVTVCAIALLMSLLATIYPARRAALIQPVDALRHD